MKLINLERSRFSVHAIIEVSGENGETVPVLDFLHEKLEDKKFKGSADGYAALFQRYAEKGRQGLTTNMFHEANKQEKIWEFIKGRLRIYCFIDPDGNAVILTHGVVKKSQKAQKSDINAAKRKRDEYLKAKAENKLEITEE